MSVMYNNPQLFNGKQENTLGVDQKESTKPISPSSFKPKPEVSPEKEMSSGRKSEDGKVQLVGKVESSVEIDLPEH